MGHQESAVAQFSLAKGMYTDRESKQDGRSKPLSGWEKNRLNRVPQKMTKSEQKENQDFLGISGVVKGRISDKDSPSNRDGPSVKRATPSDDT